MVGQDDGRLPGRLPGTPVGTSCSRQPSAPEPLGPRLRRGAAGSGSITFVGSTVRCGQGAPRRTTWSELHEEAKAVAAALQARGIGSGDHVAILSLTSRAAVTAIQGIWLAGGCVLVLPLPMRMGSLTEFLAQTRALLRHGDVRLVLLDPDLAVAYQPIEGDPPVVLLTEVQPGPGRPSAGEWREVPDDLERLAILQFTSGSTSDPKGVMLPHRVLGANLDAVRDMARLDGERDIFVLWVPLYHDMGLVGLTLCMTLGCSMVLAAPQDFLANPGDWMRWLAEYQGTITAGPNFSWALASRALRRLTERGEILDLSAVRIALNGAEPIDPAAVDELIAAAKPHGLRPEAVFCAFGMAEVVAGGTFPPLSCGMRCDAVDRSALEEEGVARPADPNRATTRRLALLGRPVPGLEMRICDPVSGKTLGERKVGELEFRGTSVTPGYYKRPDLAASLFHDGWLRTGDLAYVVPDQEHGMPELVLCGRLKDVIIIGGRNVFPEDIERSVGQLEGVRTGNVIAFGLADTKGKESIVIVAEVRSSFPANLRQSIRQRVVAVCGIPPRDVRLVAPGTIPKTSSGKLQRSLCRQLYCNQALPAVDVPLSMPARD